MEPTETELLDFAKSIPDRCKSERDIILRASLGKWDTRVRKSFAEALEGWLCQHFDLSTVESKRYLYAEGYNPIPTNLRGGAFFGTKMHPDAALIMGDKRLVAIELDHGTKGSRVRNALAKASFSVVLGGFDRALVLFFVDPPKSPANLKQQDDEQRILALYQQQFDTALYVL
jgi:hypothetical protein